jgi:acetyl esterase/lipase
MTKVPHAQVVRSTRGDKSMSESRPWDVQKTPGVPFYMAESDLAFVRRKWLDLCYAPTSAAQRLDIFLPETGEGPFPVIVHIHGGGFAAGHRRSYQTLASFRGLERGYALVTIDYRLSGEAMFPAGLQDARAAVRWLRAHAGEYRLDPARIAVFGGSSGGNYAAMACVTAEVSLFDDAALGDPHYPCDVQAAVDWFGPTDFSKMDEQLAASGMGTANHGLADSMESQYLGGRASEVPERARAANPMTYVSTGMCPILIQHGTADAVVPVQQSIEFAEAIGRKVGTDRFELDLLEGAGHDDPAFFTDKNFERVFVFLDRYLK